MLQDKQGPLLVANQRCSSYGGIQRYMTRIAEEFATHYPTVRVVEPSKRVEKLRNRRISFIRFQEGPRYLEVIRMFWAYTLQVIKQRPAFSLASLWFPSGFICAILPRTFRGPLAILAHGSEIAPSRRGFRKTLMRFTFSRADAIFANSNYVASLLQEVGISTSLQILPCGTDKYDRSTLKSARPLILSVGRLIERKGFDAMLFAMPEILKAVPGALYEIIGDGPYRDTLKQLAESLGIHDSVIFRGFVSEESLIAGYNSAHCFSMPARRIRDDVEGFGIVYLEAASAGIPTVAGLDSGASSAVENGITGYLVDGRNPSAVAKAVISILTDGRLAEQMGQQGKRRANEYFSWARVASEIAERMEKS